MSKKITIGVLATVIVILGVYYYLSLKAKEKTIGQESAPAVTTPDLNPADKANPFKDIKTNPFE
ncbi:hypothetical protein HYW73_00895 [Candidatus Nomurabacteria bacterium]|nr:hypothetical protein [Candidatus Nomurabacteria bacterium]